MNSIPRFFLFLISAVIISSCHEEKKNEQKDTLPVPSSISEFEQRIKTDPNNADLYNQRAKYYFDHKEFGPALSDVTKAISIDSIKGDYYLTLSDIYFASGKTRDSKSTLEKCIAVDPKNTEAMMKLAELYFYVKKYQDAMDHINMALKVDEHIGKAYFMKGMIFEEQLDTAKAISSMETAIEQDPNNYDAYMQLGFLYAAKKNKLAIEYFDSALRLKPKSDEVLYAKGKFYQNLEEWDNAVKTYEQLSQIYPDNKSAHYNLGVIHFGITKEYLKAIKQFDEVIRINPNYYQAYYGRGSCYEATGEKKKAAEDYKFVLKLKPDYAPAKQSLKSMQN